MAGVAIQTDISELARLSKRIDALANLDTAPLLDVLGAEVESQTRRRIEEEKTGPDGVPWPPWSEGYARTRHGGHSLLIGEGDLLDSIQHIVGAGQVEIGTNLIYGAIHQAGGAEVGKNIPARPYLGLSPENLVDLAAVLDDWVDSQLGAL